MAKIDAPAVPASSPAGARPRARLVSRDFLLLLVANVLLYGSFQMLVPTLPLYVLELGSGTVSAGLMLGFFLGSAVLIRPLAGWALDAYGRRLLLLLGLAVFLLASLSYGFVGTIALLLGLRLVHGLGFGLFSVASGTLASDLIPRTRLAEGMGYVGITWSLAVAIGPPLGLAIVQQAGFGPLFPVAAGSAAAALVLALALRYPKLEHRRVPFSLGVLVDRASAFPSLLTVLLTSSYGFVLSFVSLYGVQQGLRNPGLFFSVFAVVLTLTRPLTGRLGDHLGFSRVLVAGFVFVAAGLLVLGLATGLTGFLLAAMLYGLGFGATQPTLLAIFVDSLPASRRGAANAAFLTAWDLGIGGGSILGGFVALHLPLSQIYLLAALPEGLGALLLLLRPHRVDRREGGC